MRNNSTVVCLEENGSRPSHFGNGYIESDTMYTLNTTEVHGVAYSINGQGGSDYQILEDVAATITAATNSSGNDKAVVCYGICSYESNSFKSSNPHSGIYEADTTRTLDLNGGNPSCNQGGVAIVEVHRNERNKK